VATRTQAVPLGTVKTMPGGRPGRPPRNRNDRAARGAYTLILGAVLVVGVVALFFAVSWVLGTTGSPPPTPTPAPAASATTLPGPAAQSSPPPFFAPSPSPSPSPGLQQLPQRFHVVEGGDTLNRISTRCGVTVEAIMQANGFTDRNRILRIGERLAIPDPPPGNPIVPC
jgi:LysM repeat protein